MTEIHSTEQSLADLKALVARMEAEAAGATNDIARPYMEHLLETNHIKASTSDKSTWVGFSTKPVEIVVNGVKLSYTTIVTDVVASETRKLEKKQADAASKAEKEAADLRAKLAALEAQTGVTA